MLRSLPISFTRNLSRAWNFNKIRHLSVNSSKMSSEDEWRNKLTPEQFYVCRQKGTEAPFTGEYYKHKEGGIYSCVCCQQQLFSSESKFDSACGWPAFTEPVGKANSVMHKPDNSHGMKRIEALCSNCQSHLGHVFNDGPPPTKTRYCINSVALDFTPASQKTSK